MNQYISGFKGDIDQGKALVIRQRAQGRYCANTLAMPGVSETSVIEWQLILRDDYLFVMLDPSAQLLPNLRWRL